VFDSYAWSNNQQIQSVLEAKLSETSNYIPLPGDLFNSLATFKLGSVYAAYERYKGIKTSSPRGAFILDDKMALRALSEAAYFGEHHASSHSRKVYLSIKQDGDIRKPVVGSFQLTSVLVNEIEPLMTGKISSDNQDTCIVVNAKDIIEFTAIAQKYKILGGNLTYIDTVLEDGKAIVAMCAKASVEDIQDLSQFEVGSTASGNKVEVALLGFFHGEVKNIRPSLAYLDDLVYRKNDDDFLWLPMVKGIKSKAKTLSSEGRGFHFRSAVLNSIEGPALNVFIEAEKEGAVLSGEAAQSPVNTEHKRYKHFRKATIQVDNKLFLQALSLITGNLEMGLSNSTMIIRNDHMACGLSLKEVTCLDDDETAEIEEASSDGGTQTEEVTSPAANEPTSQTEEIPEVLDYTIVCDKGVYDKETDRIVYQNAYVLQNKKGEVERITVVVPLKEVKSIVKHKKETVKPEEEKKIGKKTTLKYRVLDIVKASAGREISFLEIMEHLPSETNQGSVNAALSFLVKSGAIKRSGTKRYTTVAEDTAAAK
jgi:hypothetical protein